VRRTQQGTQGHQDVKRRTHSKCQTIKSEQ
jgi:hypothetical protein